MLTTIPDYDILAARLQDLRDARAAEPAPLEPGDVVQWRRGFHRNTLMGQNDFGVVLGMVEDGGGAEAGERASNPIEYSLPADIELGAFTSAGKLQIFRTNRRYLEKAADTQSRCAKLLSQLAREFRREEKLRPAGLVSWKPYCAPQDITDPESPGIVLFLIDRDDEENEAEYPPSFESDSVVDIALAFDRGEFGFEFFYTDRRRVTAYKGPVAKARPGGISAIERCDWDSRSDSCAKTAARMLLRFRNYCMISPLGPGDMVRWKEGLRNRPLPLADDAAVVLQVLNIPDEFAPLSLLHDQLAVKLAFMDEDGKPAVDIFDASRFEPLESEQDAQTEFLKQASDTYLRRAPMKEGDTVIWKPGFADFEEVIDPDSPLLLLQTPEAKEPEIDYAEEESEPEMVLIAMRSNDGECVFGSVDSSRLMPAPHDEDDKNIAWLKACVAGIGRAERFKRGTIVEWKLGFCPLAWSEKDARGIIVEQTKAPGNEVPEWMRDVLPKYKKQYFYNIAFLDEDNLLHIRTIHGGFMQAAESSSGYLGEILRERLKEYVTPSALQPGQLLVSKDFLADMEDCNFDIDDPGILLRRLPKPVFREYAAGATGVARYADVVVGGMDANGEFVETLADSRRYRPHPRQNGDTARTLRGVYRRLKNPSKLTPGMLVAWKDRLRTPPGVEGGLPAIVLECDIQACDSERNRQRHEPDTLNTLIGSWYRESWFETLCDSRYLEAFDPAMQGAIYQRKATEEAMRMEEFSRMLEDFDDDDDDFPF